MIGTHAVVRNAKLVIIPNCEGRATAGGAVQSLERQVIF
jgi:hypothetical protein